MSVRVAAQDLFADLALEELARAVADERASETERLRSAERLAGRIIDRQASRRQTIADGVRRHRVTTALVGIALGTTLFFTITGRRARRRRRELEEREHAAPPWLPPGGGWGQPGPGPGSWHWRPGP